MRITAGTGRMRRYEDCTGHRKDELAVMGVRQGLGSTRSYEDCTGHRKDQTVWGLHRA